MKNSGHGPTLILRGGHVIDPAGNVDSIADIVVSGDRISEIVPHDKLPKERLKCDTVVDCTGKYVCPGLVDLHGHYYEGSAVGIDPYAALRSGVTTLVDAGTCGCINFPDFRRTVIDKVNLRILPFINIACLGIPTLDIGELLDLSYARPRETADEVLKNQDIALGIKVRCGLMAESNNMEALELALASANKSHSRVMCHISVKAPTREILGRLRPGDIVTHCFTGRGDGILDNNSAALMPETRLARSRGVIFDVGHGMGSFHWDTALKAFEHSFYPDTISTDLHRFNVERVVFDLPTTMSKFMLIGMDLKDVVEKTTLAPARAIGRAPEIGTLQPGSNADILVFSLEMGEFHFQDSHYEERVGEYRLLPELVINHGRMVKPSEVPVRLREMNQWDNEIINKSRDKTGWTRNY